MAFSVRSCTAPFKLENSGTASTTLTGMGGASDRCVAADDSDRISSSVSKRALDEMVQNTPFLVADKGRVRLVANNENERCSNRTEPTVLLVLETQDLATRAQGKNVIITGGQTSRKQLWEEFWDGNSGEV